MSTEFKPKTMAILAASLQGEMFKVKVHKIIFDSAIVSGYQPMRVPLPLSTLCEVAEARRNIAAFKKSQKPAPKPRVKKPSKTHEEILRQLQTDCWMAINTVLCMIPEHTRPLPKAERYVWREENGVQIATFQFLPEEEAILQEAGVPFRRYEFRLCPETIEEGMSTYRRNRFCHTFIWTAIKEIKVAIEEIKVAVDFLTSNPKESREH